jgi:hypothetical protein
MCGSDLAGCATLLLAVVTAIGVLVSAGMLVWKMGQQFKNTLQLQQDNFKDRMKQEIYSELSEALHDYMERLEDSVSAVNSVPLSFSTYLIMKDEGLTPHPVKDRTDKIRESSSQASKAFQRIFHLLEKYAIVLPKLSVAKLLLFEESQRLANSFGSYFEVAVDYVPMDVPEDYIETMGKKLVSLKEIEKDAAERLESLAANYAEVSLRLQAYLYDIRVILQNTLLGHLFDVRLEARKRLKEVNIVIKTDEDPSMVTLKNKLLSEGVWGRTLKEMYHGVQVHGETANSGS